MQPPSNPQSENVWTLGRLREWTRQYLTDKGCENSDLETQVLMAHALQCTRIELFTNQNKVASQEGRDRLRDLIRRRAEGCPVAYLVGYKEFFSLEFEVSPAVLIPRPDSEWIVYECLRLAKTMTSPTMLDIGTGSGCLAITIAQQHKTAQVTAIDVSSEALEIAKRNAEKHQVSDRITFLEGELFSPLESGQQFDFVISNPPYIPSDVVLTLQKEVRDYEPKLALDGGENGFAVIDRILEQSDTVLRPGGYLILEIGADQEMQARERIENLTGYELAKTIHDANGIGRVLQARRI